METMQLIEAQESLKGRYRKRFKLIKRFSFHKGKLLDLGCGKGHFLKHASLQGWDVSGVDLKAENTEFAKKVLQIKNVHCAPLGEVLLPEKTFNVVTLYDLVEHLSNPFSELKKISSAAETYYASIAPHNSNGPISTIASIHLGMSIPNIFMQEIFISFIDRYKNLLTNPPDINKGFVEISDSPGWGTDLIEDNILKYPP